jgi:hypothetical protein
MAQFPVNYRSIAHLFDKRSFDGNVSVRLGVGDDGVGQTLDFPRAHFLIVIILLENENKKLIRAH